MVVQSLILLNKKFSITLIDWLGGCYENRREDKKPKN